MAYVVRPIEQLNLKGPYIWMLDWFGGLVENPKDYRNPSIECILTPCTPDPEKATGLKRRIWSQVVTTIGVSAINAIGIGRQYVNGNFVPRDLTSGSTEEVIAFRFDPKLEGSVQEMMLAQVGITDSNVLVKHGLASNGFSSPVKIVDGQLTSTTHRTSPDRNASALHPVKFKVMFHELEIIRFYYTNSQHLARAVFGDSFQGDNLNRDVVFSKHEGPYCLLDEDRCRFEYRLGFYHDDLPIIGRVLFDPTRTAMHGVRRVFQSMHVSKVNEVIDQKTSYPRTFFPYLGKAELKLKGRRLKLKDGEFIFAVHSIESCNAPFPFESLSVQREVEPGGEEIAPMGSPEAFSGLPPKVTGPGQKEGAMDTEGRPFENSEFADCISAKRRFLGLNEDWLRIEKNRPNTHTTDERRSTKCDSRLIKSSPGTPTSGQSEAVNQKIVDAVVGSSSPVDIDTFIAILSSLRIRRSGWVVSTIPISESAWEHPTNKETYCEFPSIACPEKKSVLRQFSFHDKLKKHPRHLVCVQIFADDKFVYLLEAERRQNEHGKDMEALPILVLWSPGFVKIDDEKFQLVLAETVENPSKTWPQDVSMHGLMRGAIEHRRESKAVNKNGTLSQYARQELKLKEAVERIEKFVAGVIGQSG